VPFCPLLQCAQFGSKCILIRTGRRRFVASDNLALSDVICRRGKEPAGDLIWTLRRRSAQRFWGLSRRLPALRVKARSPPALPASGAPSRCARLLDYRALLRPRRRVPAHGWILAVGPVRGAARWSLNEIVRPGMRLECPLLLSMRRPARDLLKDARRVALPGRACSRRRARSLTGI
jgi:hypothetical protein